MQMNFQSLFFRMYVLMACLGIGLGMAILAGGADRFSGPSLTGPRNLVSWTGLEPHLVWGSAFLIYGLILVFALGRQVAVWALRGGVALYLFFVISFATSIVVEPRASITGLVAYGVFSLIHLYLSDHLHNRRWEGC